MAISGDVSLLLKVEVENAAETARLTKEIGKVEAELAKLEKPGCVDKAPAHLVERDKAQLAEFSDKLEKLKRSR